MKTKTESVKICMDRNTKNRLATYAGEQHRSVSQLITDWIWSQPVKAYTEGNQMTIAELQALTGREFRFIALDDKNTIMFAVPIPGVDTWNFRAGETLTWDDEEITARRKAWEEYVNTLPMYARRIINAGSR